MERYSISVTDARSPGEPLRLLIPYSSSATCAALSEEIIKRANKRGMPLEGLGCTLRLGSADGPILDSDDVLSDVVAGEQVFAAFQADVVHKTALENHDAALISIQIITPAMAKQYKDDDGPSFSLSASATVQQLHDDALRHLDLGVGAALDLHLHELPIDRTCFESTLEQTGLSALAKGGLLVIYAVPRPASSANRSAQSSSVRVGMNDLYEVGQHWQPLVQQTDRGMAMFLSSLRVFTHLLRGSKVQDTQRDRILSVFDLLCRFPPAVRALHCLIQGRTISHMASAGLAQAFFHILEDIVPASLIQSSEFRVFEGARLLLGLISEKAKHGALESPSLMYMSRFDTVKMQTPTPRPQAVVPLDSSSTDSRPQASSLGGQRAQSLVLSLISEDKTKATLFHPSQDAETVRSPRGIINADELADPHHLAGLCGRASLDVFMPSSLTSIAPQCLTFDRLGHLAVYTGRAACASPGHDIVLFRPAHGEETPVISSMEQELAPILQAHKADGTDVFDALGSSSARALESPDEIVMFCVDCSASMGTPTDFIDTEPDSDSDFNSDSDDDNQDEAKSLPQEAYDTATLDNVKQTISEHEVYDDMLGAVAEASDRHKTTVAEKMLTFFSVIITGELDEKSSQFHSFMTRALHDLEVKRLETLLAGIKRFKDSLVDVIVLGAMSLPKQQWIWYEGQRVPGQEVASLPEAITDTPVALRCPISYEILQDPVVAADGQTYSRQAIERWMQIRRSSPLTGLMLENTELRPHLDLADQANNWVQAADLLQSQDRTNNNNNKRRRTSPSTALVTFQGSSDFFVRALPTSLTLLDLYKVAYRGMKGRNGAFQLRLFQRNLEPSDSAISSVGIQNGSSILIVTKNNDSLANSTASPLCLVKVYYGQSFNFGCWIRKDTTASLASILAKFWRFALLQYPYQSTAEMYQVWTDLKSRGDGFLSGNPNNSLQKMRQYLTPEHAFGSLQVESVEQRDNAASGGAETHADEDDSLLVLKVMIAKVPRKSCKDRKLSRLEVLKQMFEATINRILAYSYRTHIGLITFSNTASVTQSLTHVIENFRRSVENMRAHGDTALWDGIRLAKDQIVQYAKKYPKAQKRIICLSDGNDTKSVAGPADLYWQLRQEKIAVDSICIGQENNLDLKAVSWLLNSYCFFPRDLTTALAICELEPVLSQNERPSLVQTAPNDRNSALSRFQSARFRADFTVVTRDVFPERKVHPNLRDDFIQLADCVRKGTNTSSALPNLKTSRLLVEMRDIASKPHPKYDCYVSETDMSFWEVVMEGPPDTPYAGRAFLLYLDMPENFPSFPPQGRFVTPIFHPNINRHGRICHSIFDRDWTTDTTLRTVLDTVYGLLFNVETSDAVHTTVTLGYHHDDAGFAEEARQHARKHAKKTRAQWKRELLG